MFNDFSSNCDRLIMCGYINGLITGNNCLAEDNFPFTIYRKASKTVVGR